SFPSSTTPPYVGTNGISAPAATCACSCGNPSWTAGCAPLDSIVINTGDAACGNNTNCSGPLAVPSGWNGACHGPNYYAGGQLTCGPNTEPTCDVNTGDPCNVSVRATAIAATGQGTCQPNPVAVMLPDPVWAQLGRACGDAPVGGGCNIGQACLPRPEVPYETGVCISKDGDNACPAGAFTEKHVFFSDVMDERGCADDCACGPGANGVCPATVTIYSDTQSNTCVTAVATFAAGTCFNLANNPNIAGRTVSAPGAPTGGACPATGGTPTGAATPINPKTYCCVP
ncbi:MAG TPA: hypothetical protein VLS89_14225, partial [Candidatus Nanopelagicales bacterium]|nr:hypothetical protein [Candidatus Nanopelagicales bacterium]